MKATERSVLGFFAHFGPVLEKGRAHDVKVHKYNANKVIQLPLTSSFYVAKFYATYSPRMTKLKVFLLVKK